MLQIDQIDERRIAVARATSAKRKSELGQFMTPSVIARFMVGMFNPLSKKKVFLLDPGAGIGSLTAAFVERAANEQATSLTCEPWEMDEKLLDPLQATLDDCSKLLLSAGVKFSSQVWTSDFVTAFGSHQTKNRRSSPTHVILNPPYKKIASLSDHRFALSAEGIETANLYSGFVALALKALRHGGELVAITPRSFCNGPYFRRFREFLMGHSALTQIHIFESRTHAFKGDQVLQENVIFHVVKGAKQGSVVITSSADSSFEAVTTRTVDFDQIVLPGDKSQIFHIVPVDDSADIAAGMGKYCRTMEELDIAVSTGPVVDFKLRDELRFAPDSTTAPLIYAHHFQSGFVSHPNLEHRKPNWIDVNVRTQKWMMPSGWYVAVRRLSSKEEKRRIVSAVFDPSVVPDPIIGFDNHLNVFHRNKGGVPIDLAKGLAVYLASTFADNWLRRFSGHTQVNASDLRAMRYPELATLKKWGKRVGDSLPDQEVIDKWVEK